MRRGRPLVWCDRPAARAGKFEPGQAVLRKMREEDAGGNGDGHGAGHLTGRQKMKTSATAMMMIAPARMAMKFMEKDEDINQRRKK